jgi:hypothetical protein
MNSQNSRKTPNRGSLTTDVGMLNMSLIQRDARTLGDRAARNAPTEKYGWPTPFK